MWFFLLPICLAVIVVVLKVAFWFWFIYRVGRGAGQVVQLYNQAVESWFVQIARAIQEGQRQDAIIALQRQAVAEIHHLPRHERRVHQQRLSDVMSERVRLNTRTGEWEEESQASNLVQG